MSDKLKITNDNVTLTIKCQRCNHNPMEADHTCPYSEDINGDYETMCNCCSDCQDECAMEIVYRVVTGRL